MSGAFDSSIEAHSNCSTHLRVAAESGAIPVSVFVDSAAVRRAHHFKTHWCAACSVSSADKNRVKISPAELTHLWLRNGNACGRSASPDKQKTTRSSVCARVNFILDAAPLFFTECVILTRCMVIADAKF